MHANLNVGDRQSVQYNRCGHILKGRFSSGLERALNHEVLKVRHVKTFHVVCLFNAFPVNKTIFHVCFY